MNVLLISECDKKALSQTRRILDQFAERRGERTWQTPITRDGLDTLRRLLRQSARKNTAVACHWIRGLDHSELLWVVGDRSRFNTQGAVPTNTTARNVLRGNDENDWHTGQDIHLLAGLAALLHDLGKASRAFQMRLRGELTTADGRPERNQYRHEWVSLRLFEAFVGQDDDATWLARLANPTAEDDAVWLDWQGGRLQRDGMDANVQFPFQRLAHAPLAQAVGWLVVTHHRLPVPPRHGADTDQGVTENADTLRTVLQRIQANWNESGLGGGNTNPGNLSLYWEIPTGHLPTTTVLWRKRAARLAQRLLTLRQQPDKGAWLSNPYVMHVSRLCLMLADHHYSSLALDGKGQPAAGRVPGQTGFPVHANTLRPSGKPNQPLDEHLLGVAHHSGEITHALPGFERHLPSLGDCKTLKKRAAHPAYRWQDKAADLAASVRQLAQTQGAFIVNLASTGCGKTLANARVMYALADPSLGMRCAFAMGLRTLTLQTGRSFKNLLGLGDDELAIRVGGSASRALFEHHEQEAEQSGSASTQSLFDEDGHVAFEGNTDGHLLLQKTMHDPGTSKLLAAPLLVCTIDHLTPATESQRGGRQIAPMLRLMSGDLVLDEPDDFDMADLPALTRLVHWAGLLGARVLLSSATLPPDLVQGLFEAYRNGRAHHQRNRGKVPGAAPQICCLWVDEFSHQHTDCADGDAFSVAHTAFAKTRTGHLAKHLKDEGVRRIAQLADLNLTGKADAHPTHASQFAARVISLAAALHGRHHNPDSASGKRVSFGLVRMANIEPLVSVALALYAATEWPVGLRVHLCVYHSQYPLFIRSDIEKRLDQALNRRPHPDGSDPVFAVPDIRQRLDAHPEPDHVFIVLGSPVTEVGRDHDYDWALVEPSSTRSLIQLAGRVRRHRTGAVTVPNVRVFQRNLRHFKNKATNAPAFCQPGFENGQFPLTTHLMEQLLAQELDAQTQSMPVTAIPRLLARESLDAKQSLVDLEHARMQHTMLARPAQDLNAASWWSLPPEVALLTGVIPRQQPFRQDNHDDIELVLLPDEDNEDDFQVMERRDKPHGRRGETVLVPVNHLLDRIPNSQVQGECISPWAETDYIQALSQLADDMGAMDLEKCAARFGTVTLPVYAQGETRRWRFHPALGFSKVPA
jgi:CRISPR-associated endonuclease/helicase Cas3